MSESVKSQLYLVTLIVLFFYVSASYNACSEVGFQEALNSPARLDKAVVINQGAAFTNDTLVTLSLQGGFAEEMKISNDPECSTGQWEPYVQTKSWSLSGSNAQVGVYVKYREEAAESDCVTDDIIHDNIPPGTVFQNPQDAISSSSDAAIQFIVGDNISGVSGAQCALGIGGAWSDCMDVVNYTNLQDGNYDMWVKATDNAGNEAAPVDYRWLIDTVKPEVIINSGPAAVVNITNADFIFTASDLSSGIDRVECRIDDGAYVPCASSSSHQFANVASGSHRAYIRAVDLAGNVSDDALHDWTVDVTAPTVQIVTHPDPITSETAATFEFVGLDGAVAINQFFCELSKDGNVIQASAACTSPRAYTLLDEGVHSFQVEGEDAAGNRSAPAQYDWIIDRTAPTISFVSTPETFTASQTASFTVAVTDNLSGIEKIQCQINDNVNFMDCTNPYVFQNLQAGTHTAYFKTIDRAGNESGVISHTWTIDLTKPVVVIDVANSVDALVASDAASIAFTASDPGGSGIAETLCRIDNEAEFSTCTSAATYSQLVDGDHIFYVKAVDNVGNESDVVTHQWKVDTLGPVIQITAPEMLFAGDPANVMFTVNDGTGSGVNAAATVCYYDGTVTSLCTPNIQLVFPDQQQGIHSFRVVAQDNLGNQSAEEVSWNVDVQLMDVNQPVNIVNNIDTDILFVIDNSGSMSPEHASMADKISGFLDKVSDLNWQIGITTTHVTGSSNADGRKGTLMPLSGVSNQYILDPNVPNAQTVLQDSILSVGTNGSGSERGIQATHMSFEKRFSGASDNQTTQLVNFYRDNAHLAVILISDEEESADGTTNQPQTLVDLKNTYWPNKNFLFNSIIVKPGDTACYDDQQSQSPPPSANNVVYGYKYEALSLLTNGLVGSVCESNYTNQLEGIGQKVVDLQKSVTLQCEPIDEDLNGEPDMQVLYTPEGANEPVVYNGTYTIEGLQITFDDALPEGAYQFVYKCLVVQ